MWTWLLTAIESIGLNWLYGKAVGLASDFWKYLTSSKAQKENEDQADVVQKLADQIKALIVAGQPVPPELEEKLRNESAKLIALNPPDVTASKLPINSGNK